MLDNLILGLYLADVITGLSGVVLVLGLAHLLVGGAFFFEGHETDSKDKISKGKRVLTIGTLLLFLLVLMPSKQVIYAYMGAKAVEQIAANPEVEGVAKDTLKLIKKKLKEELGEEKSND